MGGVCAGMKKGATAAVPMPYDSRGGDDRNEDIQRWSRKMTQKKSLEKSGQNGNGNGNSGDDFTGFQRATTRDYHNFIDHNSGGDLLPLSFSRELKPSTPARTPPPKDNHKSSFIGKAATVGLEKAVEVLDTLGSSMSNLNPRGGFVHGVISRGNIISILAFEVANTIAKGASLFQSLSAENVEFVKKEILHSQGVRELVSIDMKELTMIAAADKREEFDVFTKEVVRFGDLCKDPQWHYLGRYFLKLDTEYSVDKPTRAHAESTMNELTTLVQHTSELYHELHALDRFDQDYQRKRDEVLSLQLPQRESLVILQSELKDQRKLVRSLKKKSLWYKTLEEIMEKLVDIVSYLHHAIVEAFGHSGARATNEEAGKDGQRLGEAGLALHYANIVTQIDNIASRPTSLPPNVRDALYQGLPTSVKAAMRFKATTLAAAQEVPSSPRHLRRIHPIVTSESALQLTVVDVKAEMEKTLHWLMPLATNTTKAHQGFGWVGEWANNGNEFGKNLSGQSSIIRLQTLYHADKQKMERHILDLVTWLQRLMNIVRQRDNGLPSLPSKYVPRKRPVIEPSRNESNASLSQEDKELLSKVSGRRLLPGVSKSQEFRVLNRRGKVWALSRSTGNSPVRETSQTRKPDRFNFLDVMDGLVA